MSIQAVGCLVQHNTTQHIHRARWIHDHRLHGEARVAVGADGQGIFD